MANETLRARRFKVNDSADVVTEYDTLVVDAALNSAPQYLQTQVSVTTWDEGESYVIMWSTSSDSPTDTLPYRSKIAKITSLPTSNVGFTQETWDLPLLIGPQDIGNAACISRLGNTNFLTVGSGGEADQQVQKFSVGTGRLDVNYSGLERYINFKPLTETNGWITPVHRSSSGPDSGTYVLLNDGRVMYTFVDVDTTYPVGNPRRSSAIKRGYAPDLTTFLSQDYSITDIEVLFTGLNAPGCSTWKDPSDGTIYMVALWESQISTAYASDLTYGIEPFPYPNIYSTNTGYPWAVCYSSNDDGATWELYLVLQSPAGEGGGHITYNEPVDYAFGNKSYERNPGITPDLGPPGILPITIFNRSRQFSVWITNPEPGVMNGQSVVYSQPSAILSSQSGANTRNAVMVGDDVHSWSSSAFVVSAAGGYSRYHVNNQTVASFGYDPSNAPGAASLFIAGTRGEEKIFLWESASSEVRYYNSIPTNGTEMLAGAQYVQGYPAPYQLSRSSCFSNVLGNSFVLHSNDKILGLRLLDLGQHLGYSVHIIDLCSSSVD